MMKKIKYISMLTITLTLPTLTWGDDLPLCESSLTDAVINNKYGKLKKIVQVGEISPNCYFLDMDPLGNQNHEAKKITPLRYASRNLMPDTVRSLLEGADLEVNYKDPNDGSTALHDVAYYRDETLKDRVFQVAREIVRNDGDPDEPNDMGATPRTMNPELFDRIEKFLNNDMMGRTPKAKRRHERFEEKVKDEKIKKPKKKDPIKITF